MAQTQEFMVNCGTSKIPAHLLMERTRIPPGPPPSAAPLPDAAAAFRRALANPVGMPPLEKPCGRASLAEPAGGASWKPLVSDAVTEVLTADQ